MNDPQIHRTHAEEMRKVLDDNERLTITLQERSYLHPLNMAGNLQNIQALLPADVALLIGKDSVVVQHPPLGLNSPCTVEEVQTTLFALRIKADQTRPADSNAEGGATTPATAPQSALDSQVGGEHYKRLGAYQPWVVLEHWLTPEEFRGYMKGTAIAYLARERDKGGDQDIEKGAHTLRGWLELGRQA